MKKYIRTDSAGIIYFTAEITIILEAPAFITIFITDAALCYYFSFQAFRTFSDFFLFAVSHMNVMASNDVGAQSTLCFD